MGATGSGPAPALPFRNKGPPADESSDSAVAGRETSLGSVDTSGSGVGATSTGTDWGGTAGEITLVLLRLAPTVRAARSAQ